MKNKKEIEKLVRELEKKVRDENSERIQIISDKFLNIGIMVKFEFQDCSDFCDMVRKGGLSESQIEEIVRNIVIDTIERAEREMESDPRFKSMDAFTKRSQADFSALMKVYDTQIQNINRDAERVGMNGMDVYCKYFMPRYEKVKDIIFNENEEDNVRFDTLKIQFEKAVKDAEKDLKRLSKKINVINTNSSC